MKNFLVAILFLLFSSLTLAQDIVYDSIQGNRDYWFRIKAGENEQITLGLMYENLGNLTKSKVLSAAGILEGMTYGVDYIDYILPYDTITYEFKTKDPINALVYRYFLNDTTFYYFVGLRKANLGASVLEGQYLFITPLVVQEAEVKVYDGIGTDRNLIVTLKPNEINEFSLNEYTLSNLVTIQGIKVSKVLRSSKTTDYVTDADEMFAENIKIWPNPVEGTLFIKMNNENGVIIRIFNIQPKMVYQQEVFTDYHNISFIDYVSGAYIMVITNRLGIVLYTVKIVKL